jgi:hypothetical protein
VPWEMFLCMMRWLCKYTNDTKEGGGQCGWVEESQSNSMIARVTA